MAANKLTRRWIALFASASLLGSCTAHSRDEAAVLAPVESFYAAFSQDFRTDADFAAEGWNHINPIGGRTRSKAETLEDVRAVHSTFLKGVTDTIQSADVRFVSDDVAIATVVSVTSPYALPGEPASTPHQHIRTFVVVRAGDNWLIEQDHNTEVRAP